MTTHVALVARAFGADSLLISTKDEKIKKTIDSISRRFGGKFLIRTGVNPTSLIRSWKGIIVHLTMYGERLDSVLEKIDKKKDILIIVGAEKVAPYYFEVADFNVSIGNQPHSEVAALAIFLDRLTNQTWIDKKFNGVLEVVPMAKGKKVIDKKKKIE
ncbi:MAG: tRNA (cytidine(56)-2'-O)-methyltransferase [Candidatus Thermoplasmatota archaeon]